MAAYWSMEPAAVCMPYDLQLANWTMPPAVCVPGQPVEYASTEVFGSCHQISLPSCEGGQLREYELPTQYDLIETQNQEVVIDLHKMEMALRRASILYFQDVATCCNSEDDLRKNKIHKYPASIQALGLDDRYTVPLVVAIGPYYHGRENLNKAEKMKYVAAFECIKNSGFKPEEFYSDFVLVAHGVRRFYDKDVEEGIGYDDFLHMMFFDACFLVQYMLIMSDREACEDMQSSLFRFFDTYDNEIFHDIMLLENQIPWPAVESVMKLARPKVDMDKFIYNLKGCLQDRKCKDNEERTSLSCDNPPHLLGLLRYYIVGGRNTSSKPLTETDMISLSVSANEIAEIGIELKANKDTELVHMGVTENILFGELFMAPLSLTDARLSCLINMAALELCTTSNFQAVDDEESAVCSYLLLLAMLVATEEDVQKLRKKHILQGAGLANSEVLSFFSKVHDLRLGTCYVRTMIQIESYKHNRQTRTWLYGFYYRNKATIALVVSILATSISIIGTIVGIFKK